MPQRHLSASAPIGVPLLCSGAHDRLEHGACFMEYASVLAGERFSDHPSCTHPVLASACRAVNDHISDRGRQRLTMLVPQVVGLTCKNPRVTASLLLTCLDASAPHTADRMSAHRALAQRRLERSAGGGWSRATLRLTEADFRMHAVKVAAESVRDLARGGDQALERLLTRMIEVYRDVTAPALPKTSVDSPVPHGEGAQR